MCGGEIGKGMDCTCSAALMAILVYVCCFSYRLLRPSPSKSTRANRVMVDTDGVFQEEENEGEEDKEEGEEEEEEAGAGGGMGGVGWPSARTRGRAENARSTLHTAA